MATNELSIELHPPCHQKTLKLLSIMLLFWKLVRPFVYIYCNFIVMCIAGKLEEALEMYKHSKQFGAERAALHIRNVRGGLL